MRGKDYMENGATSAIAEFVANVSVSEIPDEALETARRAVLDSIACMIAGSASEVAPPIKGFLADNGQGPVPIIGTNIRATPSLAALANGTFAAALDFDDLISPLHPSAVIVAALLSQANSAALSGRQLLEAYVIGIEVGGKIARAIGQGHAQKGFHSTGTMSGFAAFVALARVADLPADKIRTGLGLIASNSGGLLCNMGSMAKPWHSGLAAQAAVDTIAMVRHGFTASLSVLEATRGFFACYGVEESDAAQIPASLGKSWTLLDPGPTMKKFPSCVAGHRAIAAVQELKLRGLNFENLAQLTCSVAPGGLAPMMYPRPKTGLESKFSMEYAIAAALLDERLTISTFETPAVERPEIADLIDRIETREDPVQAQEDPVAAGLSWGFRGYTHISARLVTGETLETRVHLPPGHPGNPLGWTELKSKLQDCGESAGHAVGKLEKVFETTRILERADSIGPLLQSLASE